MGTALIDERDSMVSSGRRRRHHRVIHVPFVVHEDMVDRLCTWLAPITGPHDVVLLDWIGTSPWVHGVWSYKAVGAGLSDVTGEAPAFVVFDRNGAYTERLCGCPPDEWSCRAVKN